MIVVTVGVVQAEQITPAWAKVPGFVDRWRATAAASPLLERSSAAPTWFGVATAGIGFALLAFGWGRIGGLGAVALQIPYLISAGCGGLGLIVAGAAIVGVQAKRREAAAREDVLIELRRVVHELERLTGERSGA